MLYGLHGFSRTGLGFRFSLLNTCYYTRKHGQGWSRRFCRSYVGFVTFLRVCFDYWVFFQSRFLVDWTAENPAGYLVRQIRILYSIGYRTKKDQNIQSILIFYYCYLCNVLVFLLTVPSQWYLLPVYCIMYISLTLSPSIFLLSNWISFLPLL